jgi:hypothetical protein
MTGRVIIRDEHDMNKKFEQLIVIMHNLRFSTKYWQQNGGGQANERRKYWEKRADEMLTELGLQTHMHIKAVYTPRIDHV